MQSLENFSKATKAEKMEKVSQLLQAETFSLLEKFQLSNPEFQQIIDDISENVISNYHLPYGIAPNFLINGRIFHIPMVIEESSVVAAAAASAKFWKYHDGFQTRAISTTKSGQVHFIWKGTLDLASQLWFELKNSLLQSVSVLTENMRARGGGIKNIEWQDNSEKLAHYHRLHVEFDTVDAMGANFINSCLESIAEVLTDYLRKHFSGVPAPQIIMSILSNYVPDCLVECKLSCKVSDLSPISGSLSSEEFATKFEYAVKIAQYNTHRAVTHNKGIFNGIDAVALATGNDFRAIEAGGHSFAAKDGSYKSLTDILIRDGIFTYILTVPLAVGTVGGLISTHPLAKLSMKILEKPSAPQLMQIMAAAGMANNFSAIRALITSGIQQGHMKLHLPNILNQLNASQEEREQVAKFFKGKKVSFTSVESFLKELRK